MGRRFPPWLRKKIPANQFSLNTRHILKKYNLNTVCQSAKCPNLGECFARDTATFMLLGTICTRDCRFCAVEKGPLLPPKEEEPRQVARAARDLGLKHVVLTSVTRDDLPDGGAQHFADTIYALKEEIPEGMVEVLTPDFQGDREALSLVVEAKPHVFNHNVETVPALYSKVRPQADYQRSLKLLAWVKEMDKEIFTKSGLMVGLGERREEILEVMEDLCSHNCDLLTIGQYLQPSRNHLEVEEYIHPDLFDEYREEGMNLGFLQVFAGPFVRSSFKAADLTDPLFGQKEDDGDDSHN